MVNTESTTTDGNAIIYCRVSNKKQKHDGDGRHSQEHRCRDYANAGGYVVEAVFNDDVSGGGDFMKRPGMVAMLRFLKKRGHEDRVVIFDDLKRFARDTVFHLKLRQELATYNATVECLNFKFEDTPEGQFVETVIAAQGQLERLQNRRQTLQKMKARVERGYYVFAVPMGYRPFKVLENFRGGKIEMARPEGFKPPILGSESHSPRYGFEFSLPKHVRHQFKSRARQQPST